MSVMRPVAKESDVDRMLDVLKGKIMERLKQKGWGIYMSSHECLGIITEEYMELCEAVRADEGQQIWREALDLAVGALFTMVSIVDGRMDWP